MLLINPKGEKHKRSHPEAGIEQQRKEEVTEVKKAVKKRVETNGEYGKEGESMRKSRIGERRSRPREIQYFMRTTKHGEIMDTKETSKKTEITRKSEEVCGRGLFLYNSSRLAPVVRKLQHLKISAPGQHSTHRTAPVQELCSGRSLCC